MVKRTRRGHLRFRFCLLVPPAPLSFLVLDLGFGSVLGSGGVKGSNLPDGP